jgi:sodium-dependent phosphate cotransporter
MARRTQELERDLEKEAQLVEIDGEFCVPVEANQARYLIDWGPFEPPRSRWTVAKKVALFIPAMFLFILATQLMKEGAALVGPQIQGQFPFANGVSTMGFGWLGAYFVLSGSPVAATAVSLFGAGTLTELQAFTMLAGSRLGASFIVLLTGFLYAMKNRDADRGASIGIGVQAITTTALVYLPGIVIGYAIIKAGWLDGVDLHASAGLDAVLSRLWGPIVDAAASALPGWALFLVGLGVILVSFNLLDHVLPTVSSDATASKRAVWLRKPWTMFLLGCLVATLTLSVSVALTILVPLASRGLVKREEALPYIMGANVMTLADTLVVAMLQPTSAPAHIVLAMAIGVTVVSLVLIAFAYDRVKTMVIGLDDWLLESNQRLAIFIGGLFVIPLALLGTGFFYATS